MINSFEALGGKIIELPRAEWAQIAEGRALAA